MYLIESKVHTDQQPIIYLPKESTITSYGPTNSLILCNFLACATIEFLLGSQIDNKIGHTTCRLGHQEVYSV